MSQYLIKASFALFITTLFSPYTQSTMQNSKKLPEEAHEAFSIIAHRGASGFLPEHSAPALVLAFMQGADYIEQDLVLSKDNHLIVLHDIYLETVTNVEEIFPKRQRADGRYYAIDFTLEELRQVSLHERQNQQQKPVFPSRYQGNSHFSITTFKEHVELIRELNRQLSRDVGWYPEIKSPAWHLQEGKNIALILYQSLESLGLNNTDEKIYVQSFEPNSLKYLKHQLKIKVGLVQLIGENSWQESNADYLAMQSEKGLVEIAQYADGIGPWLHHVYNHDNEQIKPLLTLAKKHNLLVHPYTHREDDGNSPIFVQQRFKILKKAGINGIFTDQIMPYMKSP